MTSASGRHLTFEDEREIHAVHQAQTKDDVGGSPRLSCITTSARNPGIGMKHLAAFTQ